MPETTLRIKWPDEKEEDIYSPSSIIHQYFNKGDEFSIVKFEEISKKAFQHASDRVEATYGYACTSAHASLARILEKSSNVADRESKVKIIGVS